MHGAVVTQGLHAAVEIRHSGSSLDSLTVDGRGGNDDIAVDENVPFLIEVVVSE